MKNQSKIDEGWIEVKKPEDTEREVYKIEQNKSIEGLLTERRTSHDFGYVYYLKVKDDPIEKVILGTTMLNQLMQQVEDGQEIIIERLKDIKTSNNRTMHDYTVYTKGEEGSS